MAHEGLHENEEKLAPATVDSHRALLSLMEELEAVDWYQQRADACIDDGLRAVLLHNMHEEMEHAAMVLEWLRRRTPRLDEILRVYLFSQGDITLAEKKATGKEGGEAAAPNSFGESLSGFMKQRGAMAVSLSPSPLPPTGEGDGGSLREARMRPRLTIGAMKGA